MQLYEHEYRYKPSPRFKGNANREEECHFGLELEVEFYDSDYFSNFYNNTYISDLSNEERDFYCKYDSSLDCGTELVFHPRTLKSWYKFDNMKNILNELDDRYRAVSHDSGRCGLHIHIDRRYLVGDNRQKFIDKYILAGKFAINTSNILYKLSRRKSYEFCKMFSSGHDNYTLRNIYHNNLQHYDRHNIICATRNTLEWRLFQGTLKYSSLISAIEFCHFLSNFLKYNNTNFDFTDFNLIDALLNSNIKYKYLPTYLKERKIIS